MGWLRCICYLLPLVIPRQYLATSSWLPPTLLPRISLVCHWSYRVIICEFRNCSVRNIWDNLWLWMWVCSFFWRFSYPKVFQIQAWHCIWCISKWTRYWSLAYGLFDGMSRNQVRSTHNFSTLCHFGLASLCWWPYIWLSKCSTEMLQGKSF